MTDTQLSSRRGAPDDRTPTTPVAVLSPGQVAWRRALKHGGFWIGGGILLLIVLAAIAAPLLAPYDPATQSLGHRFVPPVWNVDGSTAHLLGTDSLGRDVLSRLIFGARTSVMLGVLTVLVSGFIGVTPSISRTTFVIRFPPPAASISRDRALLHQPLARSAFREARHPTWRHRAWAQRLRCTRA